MGPQMRIEEKAFKSKYPDWKTLEWDEKGRIKSGGTPKNQSNEVDEESSDDNVNMG